MYGEHSVTITKVTGGYLLEWRKPEDDDYQNSATTMWTRKMPPKTSDRELFTDVKKAIKRAEALLL